MEYITEFGRTTNQNTVKLLTFIAEITGAFILLIRMFSDSKQGKRVQ